MKRTLLVVATMISGVVVGLWMFGPSQESDLPKASGAMQALDFWTAARAYPNADIAPDKHYAGTVQARKNISRLASSAVFPWEFMGPINFSGRMISVALNPLNPNTIYAGSAAGGLWRSYSSGINGDWTRIVTGYPVLGVNAIAIHPADSNTLYIGTGEVYGYHASTGGIVIRTTRGSYGMGILKTTDGGSTWTKSLDWSYNQERGVQCIRINPTNPSTVLAATSEGVYRSVDGGANWTLVLAQLMARDIAIHPQDTTLVLAACGNFSSPGAGLYRSTDGGQTFSAVSGLPAFSGYPRLDMYWTDPSVVFASLADSTTGAGSLWKSTNFGVTWSSVNTEAIYGVQGWYSQFVAVHPTDTAKIVRGAQNLYKSYNGGVTQTQIYEGWADYHDYAYHPSQPNVLYIADDGGIWRSEDFGDSYAFVGQGLQTSQFYNGFSNSGSDSLVALGQVQDHFGWMYVGLIDWIEGAVDEVGWTAINQQDDYVMYAGSRGGGGLYKSIDRGASYFYSASGMTSASSAWNTPFVLSPSNPNVMYFGRSKVFKTTNAASTWFVTNGNLPLDGNPPLSMAVAPSDPGIVMAATAPLIDRSHVFRTTNGGTSWIDVTGNLPDRYPMDVAIDPADPQTAYIAYGGSGTPHFFKTTDGGFGWEDITHSLPDVPATAVAVDPFMTSHIYAGTDIGLFVSTDAGSSWIDYNEGLPEAVIVSDITVSPSNRMLRAATHSNGVYQRRLYSSILSGVSSNSRSTVVELAQNYPNPFNPTTTIRYAVSAFGHVRLRVYNVLGQEVKTLVDGAIPAGHHVVEWDGLNRSGHKAASGLYICRLEAGNQTLSRKMLLVK